MLLHCNLCVLYLKLTFQLLSLSLGWPVRKEARNEALDLSHGITPSSSHAALPLNGAAAVDIGHCTFIAVIEAALTASVENEQPCQPHIDESNATDQPTQCP